MDGYAKYIWKYICNCLIILIASLRQQWDYIESKADLAFFLRPTENQVFQETQLLFKIKAFLFIKIKYTYYMNFFKCFQLKSMH